MSQLSFESLFLADQTDPQPRVSAPVRVLSPAEARKQFASVFRQTARYMRRSEVFRDFITLAASGLDMARIHAPENIENSRRICERYQPDDLDAMRHLFCLLVEGLAGEMHDFLGALYMEHELGADEMGQYFSPSSISRLLAGLLMPDAEEKIKREGWITIDEPACGSAGMVVALAYWMVEAGLNPSEQLYATCTDIDPMVADMAFIQLSLLGIPAKVVTGNTLTLKANRVRYTPVYYFNDWQGRLEFRSRFEAMKNFLATVAA
ncbi:N-6 DNA methylase [Enterobacter cancerogenus]|uniref:N-6 DNA methylase n=1 Tax=Enterobacter cancerogenus TaxID=69218 RepID=UPI000C9C0208|nr:N-6 DNA methylase [Enterobacter cancerogenus]ELC6355153.1 N-6 DNA methylase [Enterobacter hormaechei]PNF13537.1 N-6 DNA methylase [Enterobacter cancerogenus]